MRINFIFFFLIIPSLVFANELPYDGKEPLLKDYSGPLTKSLQSYNLAVRELAQSKQSGTGARVSTFLSKRLQPNNITTDPMFMGMATSMFRMGRGKKDLGRLLTTDEPADILSNIKKFSELGNNYGRTRK